MRRSILVVSCSLGALLIGACNDDEPTVSESFCRTAVRATTRYGDSAGLESLVVDAQLPERFRDRMAAAERAREAWATSDAWSNDDLVDVVNSMYDTELSPVTIAP